VIKYAYTPQSLAKRQREGKREERPTLYVMNTNMRKKDRNTMAPYKDARRALDTGGTGVLCKKHVIGPL